MTHPLHTKSRSVVTHVPQTRLTSLVNRPGGMWRDQAIAEAERRVEELRATSMDVIDDEIGQLEAMGADFSCRPHEQLTDIKRVADRVITLAGTFGLSSLSEAAKRLCDLTNAFADREFIDRGSIEVHIRAIRLFGPKSPAVRAEAALTILLELRKVLEHFGVAIPDDAPDSQFDPESDFEVPAKLA